MKNILTHLTGIVFVITILIAGACNSTTKENGEAKNGVKPKVLGPLSKDVEIFLRDTFMDGRMHLEMYDSRDTNKRKVDTLYTLVQPGSIVTWKKAHNSNVKKVLDIHSPEVEGKFFSSGDTLNLLRSLYTLEIPENPAFDTIKYEIVFTVKKDGEEKESAWCIDPYLRIEE